MEKINVKEILEKCPSGTNLYSPIFGEGVLTKITNRIHVKFEGEHNVKCFDFYGRYSPKGECMLFPSSVIMNWTDESVINRLQTSIKDGDLVCLEGFMLNKKETWPCIAKNYNINTRELFYYVGSNSYRTELMFNSYYDVSRADVIRKLTPDEKRVFFEMLWADFKENHKDENFSDSTYYVLKDWIIDISGNNIYTLNEIVNGVYDIMLDEISREENKKNLKNKCNFKTFDKVLVVNDGWWEINFFSRMEGDKYVCLNGEVFERCIPYEGNEELNGSLNHLLF